MTDDHKFKLDDHNYGKSGVKILHLVRNGKKISRVYKSI